MLNIQTVGTEILTDSPRNFYFMFGQEFGVKDRYLEHLKNLYDNQVCFDDITSLIDMLSSYMLVKLPPTLYVVRDDFIFMKSIDSTVASKLTSISVEGCVIFLYSSNNYLEKADKFFPDNCVLIESIDSKYIKKYLSQEFPSISNSMISKISKLCKNYGQGRLVCRSLQFLESSISSDCSEEETPQLSFRVRWCSLHG